MEPIKIYFIIEVNLFVCYYNLAFFKSIGDLRRKELKHETRNSPKLSPM